MGGLRSQGVLVLRPGQPEQDHTGYAEGAEPFDLDGHRVDGVVDHARQGPDGTGPVDTVGHEQRSHQVVDAQSGLGHQSAQGRAAPQPTQTGRGKSRPAGPGPGTGEGIVGHHAPDYGRAKEVVSGGGRHHSTVTPWRATTVRAPRWSATQVMSASDSFGGMDSMPWSGTMTNTTGLVWTGKFLGGRHQRIDVATVGEAADDPLGDDDLGTGRYRRHHRPQGGGRGCVDPPPVRAEGAVQRQILHQGQGHQSDRQGQGHRRPPTAADVDRRSGPRPGPGTPAHGGRSTAADAEQNHDRAHHHDRDDGERLEGDGRREEGPVDVEGRRSEDSDRHHQSPRGGHTDQSGRGDHPTDTAQATGDHPNGMGRVQDQVAEHPSAGGGGRRPDQVAVVGDHPAALVGVQDGGQQHPAEGHGRDDQGRPPPARPAHPARRSRRPPPRTPERWPSHRRTGARWP